MLAAVWWEVRGGVVGGGWWVCGWWLCWAPVVVLVVVGASRDAPTTPISWGWVVGVVGEVMVVGGGGWWGTPTHGVVVGGGWRVVGGGKLWVIGGWLWVLVVVVVVGASRDAPTTHRPQPPRSPPSPVRGRMHAVGWWVVDAGLVVGCWPRCGGRCVVGW